MNAVTVYVKAAKLVLQSTETSNANICSNNELPRQLLSLRQLLSCVVCCRLATDPFSPNHGRCHHSVCRLCMRGQKNLNPSCTHCRDCRDFKSYDENKQLRCVLVCYKSLCEHLRSSAVFPLLAGRKLLQYNVMSPMLIMPQMSLQDLIVEGASYDDIITTFSKDLAKPIIYMPTPKQQPQLPALVAPLSTSAATPLAPIQQNIKCSGINQMAPKAATPPTSATGPISNLPSTHTPPTKVKVETSIQSFKVQPPGGSSANNVAAAVSLQGTSTTYSHPHLIQLNQLKNAGNITYIGNTRGIVVPISSSGTTTVPLSIASARLQSLNRQLAQARALQVVSSTAPSSTTNPTTVSSSHMDTRPQLAAFKVSIASTLPSAKAAPPLNTTSLPSSTSLVNAITTATVTSQMRNPPPIKTVSNGSAMYSVLYTGIGNKITIKRKTDGDEDAAQKKNVTTGALNSNPTLVRTLSKNNNKKRGCRCGNTTATPGKLTCCGQRCPCYVDSKSCIGCKCRGCRNPHRPDGNKVRPVIPELACYEIQMADDHANANELPIATTSANVLCSLNGDAGNESVVTSIQPTNTLNIKSSAPSATENAATLIPIRSLQQTSRSSPLPPLTSTTVSVQQTANMTQASLGTTPASLTSTVQLDQMQRESLLIQNAEGKFQVVNLFTTSTGQTTTQVPGLQRLQAVSVSGSSNFILPSSISTTSHSGTTTTTSLPQFILQSQQQQQQHPLHPHSISTRIPTGTLPLQLQQQLKQNIITVHTIGSNASNSTANSSPATASVLTPSSSPAPTTATLTLTPLVMSNSQNQTSTTGEIQNCGNIGHRYANIVVSNSPATTVSAGTTTAVRDVITSPMPVALGSGSISHHNTTINLKALESSNV